MKVLHPATLQQVYEYRHSNFVQDICEANGKLLSASYDGLIVEHWKILSLDIILWHPLTTYSKKYLTSCKLSQPPKVSQTILQWKMEFSPSRFHSTPTQSQSNHTLPSKLANAQVIMFILLLFLKVTQSLQISRISWTGKKPTPMNKSAITLWSNQSEPQVFACAKTKINRSAK